MNKQEKRKYDLAVFDVDGTLLNTEERVLKSAEYAILQTGREVPDFQTMRTFIGPPIQDSFQRVFHIQGKDLARMTETFRSCYSTQNLLKAVPYDGLYEMLDNLFENGIRIAIATYKREDYALKIIQYFGFDRYSDSSHGADTDNRLKKVDIINLCIQECSVTDRSKVVMIGDTEHDAAGAKQAGIDFIGVTWGFGFRNTEEVLSAGAVGSAEKPVDILKYMFVRDV